MNITFTAQNQNTIQYKRCFCWENLSAVCYCYFIHQLFKHNGNTNLTSDQVQKENTLHKKMELRFLF